jgi:predicted RNA-binding Zn-ribbon protein involved in translation (DUF1610 family)
MKSTAYLIESDEWGVGFGSPNPEPHAYQKCANRTEAERLVKAINKGNCPKCGSNQILAPAQSLPMLLTCDPCGFDWDWRQTQP